MLEILLLPLTKYPLITITWSFILLRIFRPMKASDGRPSNTLTGLFCTTVIIFMVTILDSINDRPDVSSQTSITETKKGTKVRSRRRGATAMKPAKARGVVKEKYGILGTLWIGFALLYLLSHKGARVWDMGLRFLVAIRGKFDPLKEENILDNFVVESLKEDQDAENKEWALRMVLAKQGVVTEKALKEEIKKKQENSDWPITEAVGTGTAKEETEDNGVKEAEGGIPSFMTEE